MWGWNCFGAEEVTSVCFFAGGTSLLLIGPLNEVNPRLPLPARLVVGSGIITMVELAAGLMVNRDHRVWDYRRLRGNFLGQICPVFSLLWVPVSGLALLCYEGMKRIMLRTNTEPGRV